MRWQDLLDHLITVEGECMEENYGAGRALNESDEECNTGIRQGYAELLKVRSILMAAPEMLAALRLADNALDYAQAQVDSERDAAALRSWRRDVQRAIASAVGTKEMPVRQ